MRAVHAYTYWHAAQSCDSSAHCAGCEYTFCTLLSAPTACAPHGKSVLRLQDERHRTGYTFAARQFLDRAISFVLVMVVSGCRGLVENHQRCHRRVALLDRAWQQVRA